MFKEMNLWEKLLIRLFPARRRKYEKELREAIEYLMNHPEAPCAIEGEVIPDGFGGRRENLVTPNKGYWNLFRKHQRKIGLWAVPHPSRFSPLTGL
jgi:plasmid stabilization system protein ParE